MAVANGKTLLGVGAVVLILAGVGGLWLFLRRDPPRPEKELPFRDIAARAGLTWQMRFLPSEQGETFKVNLYDHGSGVAVGDYDQDGHDDVYFVNQLGPNVMYRNRGDGTFEDVTRETGLGMGDRICTSATFADYANEGRQSLFVTSTRGGNVLFRNMGDGTFKDITREVGLTHVGHSQAGYFFDYDNDGYLDLLVLQTGAWTTDDFDEKKRYYPGKGLAGVAQIAASPKEYNILYHNEPDGKGGRRFVDVSEKTGLKGKGWAADAALFDYNGDGRVDVLITSMFGPSQLYRNDGGTFTEVTRQILGRTPAGGMGARAFDIDNDGRLDLYIVDMHSDMWLLPNEGLSPVDEKRKYRYMFVADYQEKLPQAMALEKLITDLIGLRYDEVLFGNTFHHNLGATFTEISDQANLETFWPWGIATGDFDNDGYEDAFIPSGMGYPWGYWPNRLMMNNRDRTFRERSQEMGIEPPLDGPYLKETIAGKPAARSSRAAAVADFDGDGRLDIVVNNFNDSPYYFRNHFPRQNHIAFRLRGTKSNRDAIGALVRLHMGEQQLTRQVNTAAGYLSQSSKTLHFGLGNGQQIDKVEVIWPSGIKQTIEKPRINQLHQLEEPAK